MSEKNIDIGTVVSNVFENPIPWGPLAIAGLHLFIPVVGPIVLFGWQKRIYEAACRGDNTTIPAVEFGNDLSNGVAPFLAMLNNVLLVFLFLMVAALLAGCGGGIAFALSAISPEAGAMLGVVLMMIGYVSFFFAWFALIIVLNLLGVEFTRRGFKGDTFPLAKYKEIWWLLKNHPKDYLMTFLGVLVYGMLGGVGAFACYVGLFVTMPLSMVMVARLKAQWNEKVTSALLGQQTPPLLRK